MTTLLYMCYLAYHTITHYFDNLGNIHFFVILDIMLRVIAPVQHILHTGIPQPYVLRYVKLTVDMDYTVYDMFYCQSIF